MEITFDRAALAACSSGRARKLADVTIMVGRIPP
jgi:hypothetical protein